MPGVDGEEPPGTAPARAHGGRGLSLMTATHGGCGNRAAGQASVGKAMALRSSDAVPRDHAIGLRELQRVGGEQQEPSPADDQFGSPMARRLTGGLADVD
jgi:hypothetical protein